MASLMATTTMSPSPAYRRLDPPSTRITSALRAPELSAILRIDSCCTTVASPPLLRPLDDVDHPPALGLGQGPRLHDPDRVPGLRPELVVGGDRLRPYQLLAVQPVREPPRQRNCDGLLHLVAHHHARADLTGAPHAGCLSRRMVWIRA